MSGQTAYCFNVSNWIHKSTIEDPEHHMIMRKIFPEKKTDCTVLKNVPTCRNNLLTHLIVLFGLFLVVYLSASSSHISLFIKLLTVSGTTIEVVIASWQLASDVKHVTPVLAENPHHVIFLVTADLLCSHISYMFDDGLNGAQWDIHKCGN